LQKEDFLYNETRSHKKSQPFAQFISVLLLSFCEFLEEPTFCHPDEGAPFSHSAIGSTLGVKDLLLKKIQIPRLSE
jgi:hypothetical protein